MRFEKQSFVLAKGGVLTNIVAAISALSKDQPLCITVDRIRNKRSEYQNHALFGVAYKMLANWTGHTKDELHTAMCKKFYGVKRKEIFGIALDEPVRRTTTDENGDSDIVTTEIFSEFYAMVQREGAEVGCVIPDPDRSKRTR